MISTQTICVGSSRHPQPGLGLDRVPVPRVSSSPCRSRVGGLKRSSAFQKAGHGGSTTITSARKLATSSLTSSSSFSSAEAEAIASHGEEFPAAKDAAVSGVRTSTGTKIVELEDSISPTKLASSDEQLPPLFSLVIDGFPPLQQSKYVDEAEKQLHQYARRDPNIPSWNAYCRVGLSATSYVHPKVISLDRLVVISLNYALVFLLDDLFFDTPSERLQNEYGISRSSCESPEKIKEYLDHLDAIFKQRVRPSNPIPIETLMWEVGQKTLELSNIEWFDYYVECVVEHHHATVVSEVDIVQGHKLCFQDLESYTFMRIGNAGAKFVLLMVEFAKDTYIPSALRRNPYLEAVTTATSIHLVFVNDIFSYHKESSLEGNPRNLITVLMECEGKPFIQTMHMAIGLVNTYAHVIMDLEAKAWNPTLQSHLHDIKALIAGNIYFCSIETRYRHPDSFFLELKDETSSWKIPSHAKGLGL